MKVGFKTSFLKDVGGITNKAMLKRIKATIENAETTENLQNIADLKKLKGGDRYYRIRVGEYRIGLLVQEDTCIFVRCLHRKDIYRYFP